MSRMAWLGVLLGLMLGCGEDDLPDFATGLPRGPLDVDAGVPSLDAQVPAAPSDAATPSDARAEAP